MAVVTLDRVLETPPLLELDVRPWLDERVDATGHDPQSRYVETYWLGIIGPTATWLVRRFGVELALCPEGFVLDVEEWSGWLGVGAAGGWHSSFGRALTRCTTFGLARLDGVPGGGAATVRVRRRLPTLSATQLRRLPAALRDAHDAEVTRGAVRPVVEILRERSRALAASLRDLGEDRRSVELQLMRWRFHPAIARESAAWVFERPAGAPSP